MLKSVAGCNTYYDIPEADFQSLVANLSADEIKDSVNIAHDISTNFY